MGVFDLLQNGSVVVRTLSLSFELVAADSKHSPVLLEDTEVG